MPNDSQPKRRTSGLSVRQLCAWFEGNGNHPSPVFWGVSVEVPAGSIMGVAGPNGSGKTTFMRCITGLHPWRTGEIKVNGQPATARKIGVVPQTYAESFFPWASLLTNIAMVGNSSRPQIAELAEAFSLNLDLNLRPPQCSGGMIQQAAILRALASNPSLLVADEPFAALDVRVAATMRKALQAFVRAREIPAIVVSHDLLSLVELCDSVLVVPGIPYSTTSIDGYESAKVIPNENLASLDDSAPSSGDDAGTFVERMTKLLHRT